MTSPTLELPPPNLLEDRQFAERANAYRTADDGQIKDAYVSLCLYVQSVVEIAATRSRRQALEEAALLCETDDGLWAIDGQHTANLFATAIRALK
jgi:hypothetical protein